MPLKQYIFDFSKDGDYLRDKVKVGSLEYKMTARGAALDEDMRWTTLGESRAAGKAVSGVSEAVARAASPLRASSPFRPRRLP